MTKVRGTQSERPLELEITKDTVYERTSITRIEEAATDERPAFSGWEYEEKQYSHFEWQQQEALTAKIAIAELAEALLGGGGND